MPSFNAAMKAAKESKWGETIRTASEFADHTTYVPSGSFRFDLTTFGGWPEGCQTHLFGMEGAMKTFFALNATASIHKAYPKAKAVYLEVEPGGFDPDYAEAQGVDLSRLILVPCPVAEEAAEAMINFARTDDVHHIILDSIAAMVTEKGDKRNAETMDKTPPPERATIMNRTVASVTSALIRDKMSPNPRKPLITWINQWRHAPTSFGDPRYTPSSGALKFQSRLSVELQLPNSQKGMRKDERVGCEVPSYNELNFVLHKERGATGVRGSFTVNVDHEHPYLKPGQIDEVGTVMASAVGFKLLTGGAGEFVLEIPGFDAKVVKTQKAMEKALLEDETFTGALKDHMIGMWRQANGKKMVNEDGTPFKWKAGT